MGEMPIGPLEHPLDRLTPDQFEMLAFLLARDDSPGVVHVRRKDHGLDARLPDPQGGTVRGWQSKRFLDDIHWDQCQFSIKRATAFWRPLRITFVFPKVLSGIEQEKFRTELIETFPRIRLDWWDASELQPRMRDTQGGRDAATWLFGNPEADKDALQRALAVGGPLSDAAHAAERIAEIQRFVNRDPHLRYTTISREGDAPETPPAPGTIISLEAVFGEIRVRFDGSERYPGGAVDAQLGGFLRFSDDEDGRLAFEAFQRVTRDGGSVELSSGVSTQIGQVPVGLRGLVPEDEQTDGMVRITAQGQVERPAPTFPVIMRAGSAELGIVLSYVQPADGWDVTIAGAAGGLQLFMSLRGDDQHRDRKMDWRWRLGEGTAMEQLLAADLMREAYNGALVQLISPEDEKVVAELTMDRGPGQNEELADIDAIYGFLENAAEAERWLGVPLRPAARPSDADGRVLAWLISQIRNPRRDGTFNRMRFTLVAPTAGQPDQFQMVLLSARRATLFGEEHFLGTELIHVRSARFEHITGEEQTGDTVSVVPGDDDNVEIQFVSPSELAEGASLPRSST